MDLCEFKSNLVYKASLRSARAAKQTKAAVAIATQPKSAVAVAVAARQHMLRIIRNKKEKFSKKNETKKKNK